MSRRPTAGSEVLDARAQSRPERGDRVRDHGAIVVDADDSDPFDERSRAVVVNLPPIACDEWGVYFDEDQEVTVADENPAYESDAPVVVVAFLSDLRCEYPDWGGNDPLTLPLNCQSYSFPPKRLQRVGTYPDTHERVSEEELNDPRDRLTNGQQRLRERLAEQSEVDVRPDPRDRFRAVLVVHKLGEKYVLDADGAVSDGPIAGRLAKVAAEYLGGESE